MEVKDCKVGPYEEHISPALRFDVEIGYQRYAEIIMGVKGWLKIPDGRIIADAYEIEAQRGGEIAARGSHFDSASKEGIYKTTAIATLSRKALDTINDYRIKNRKRDVRLLLELLVRYLVTRAYVSHLHQVEPKEVIGTEILIPTSRREEKGWLILSAYDPEFSPSLTNLWVISGDGNPIFLAENNAKLKEEVTISSSDWIHDFAPKLELGEYFVVEVPKEGVIREAWNYVKKAESCMSSWDTKGVFANCREIGDLLDRTIRDELGEDSFAYKQKWGRFYGKFGSSASLGLHMEEIKRGYPSSDVKIGKEEAEHILISAKSLIKYAENLLRPSG